MRDAALKAFRKFLDELPKGAAGENSTEVLRRQRLQWDGRPIDVLEGR